VGGEADAEGFDVVEGEWRGVEKGEALERGGLEPGGEIVLDDEAASRLAGEIYGEMAVIGIVEEILAGFGARGDGLWRERFGWKIIVAEKIPIVEGEEVAGMGDVDGVGDLFLELDEGSENEMAGAGEAGMIG